MLPLVSIVFEGTLFVPVSSLKGRRWRVVVGGSSLEGRRGGSSLEVIPAVDPGDECCTFRGSVLAIDMKTEARAIVGVRYPTCTSRGQRC